MIIKNALASESCHWYRVDGSPAYTTEGTKGIRPTTLRDARKVGYVPSVSTILKSMSKPGLDIWKQKQLLEAALTLPRNKDESLDDYAVRVIHDSKEQARKAAEKGSEIHEAIEKDMQGISFNKSYYEHVCAARKALEEINAGGNWKAEKSFASSMGYGGKCDLHNESAVVDFKTKDDWIPKTRLAYDEHGMQLKAYGEGFGLNEPRLINVFISVSNPGKYALHEWETKEHPKLWSMFQHILNFWKLSNSYDASWTLETQLSPNTPTGVTVT